MTRGKSWLAGLIMAAALAAPAWAQKKMPYFMSIKASEAKMRAGPGRNYPASWLYKRRDLPVRVTAAYGEWRKVQDPSGTEGWMQANLLDDRRSAIVVDAIVEMRSAPDATGHINWRAAPGVVGRISHCASGWCWFDVRGRGGYVEAARLWGIDPGETVN